mmetsp:Transcript_33992/g.66947  ORF Transcript_33992/g.66947 Transcript_33992/m.66947 type:complete len:395 (+) Transcript_33992:373-1557(+)
MRIASGVDVKAVPTECFSALWPWALKSEAPPLEGEGLVAAWAGLIQDMHSHVFLLFRSFSIFFPLSQALGLLLSEPRHLLLYPVLNALVLLRRQVQSETALGKHATQSCVGVPFLALDLDATHVALVVSHFFADVAVSAGGADEVVVFSGVIGVRALETSARWHLVETYSAGAHLCKLLLFVDICLGMKVRKPCPHCFQLGLGRCGHAVRGFQLAQLAESGQDGDAVLGHMLEAGQGQVGEALFNGLGPVPGAGIELVQQLTFFVLDEVRVQVLFLGLVLELAGDELEQDNSDGKYLALLVESAAALVTRALIPGRAWPSLRCRRVCTFIGVRNELSEATVDELGLQSLGQADVRCFDVAVKTALATSTPTTVQVVHSRTEPQSDTDSNLPSQL